jgi:predicted dehydrogenase
MYNFHINRRHFLKGATASLALTALGANAMDIINPAKPLKVGLIGSGWYGKSDLFKLMQVVPVEVVALCDVDKNTLSGAIDLVKQRQKSGKAPKGYGDYRKMLSENKMDIVLIGSPDHWHALQAIEALKSGAHVYLQKPISLDVMEGEAIMAASQKYNRVIQVGTQRRGTPHLIEAKKNIIEAGLLGKVSHVEMFCYYHMRANDNPPLSTVPDFLDYEMWTGPAQLRPYDKLPHGGWWRAFMEYGNGILGDMCMHMLDAVRWMLDLGWPKQISSTGGIYVQKNSKANTPDTQTAIFEFDDLNCIWQHRSWGAPVDPEYPWGFKIYGEKGTLAGSVFKYEFIPQGEGQKIVKDVLYEREKYPEDLTEHRIELHTAPATRAMMIDLLKAINEGTKPVANIEQGHISSASCILANVSMKLGRPLKYDSINKIIVGDPEATDLLQRKYRTGWVHPYENFKGAISTK